MKVKKRKWTKVVGGKRVTGLTAKYYGLLKVDGKWKPVPLSTDKRASEVMLLKMRQDAERAAVGAADPFAAHARTPLADHATAWVEYMAGEGFTPHHVATSSERTRKVLAGCQFAFPADLAPGPVKKFLAARRKAAEISIPDGQEWFRVGELAALLGVKQTAIPPTVRRHRLAAEGSGKTRRFPRATAEALAAIRAKGASARTANIYLASLNAFANWMVFDGRLPRNPFAEIEPANEAVDKRHARRSYTDAELAALLTTTAASGKVVRGLPGPTRTLLYETAAGTGFRVGELRILSVLMLHLDRDPPTVEPPARGQKNRKQVFQPLAPSLAGQLAAFVAGRPASAIVFPGGWAEDAAEMLRGDCLAAGVEYAVQSPNGPLFADFHALRHTYIRRLDDAGATLKEAMQLARHSDPKLTMAVYGQRTVGELGRVVGRLDENLYYATRTEPDETGQNRTKKDDSPVSPVSAAGLENRAGTHETEENMAGTPGRARTVNRPLRRRQGEDSKDTSGQQVTATVAGGFTPALLNNSELAPSPPPPDPLRTAFEAADARTRRAVLSLLDLDAGETTPAAGERRRAA